MECSVSPPVKAHSEKRSILQYPGMGCQSLAQAKYQHQIFVTISCVKPASRGNDLLRASRFDLAAISSANSLRLPPITAKILSGKALVTQHAGIATGSLRTPAAVQETGLRTEEE